MPSFVFSIILASRVWLCILLSQTIGKEVAAQDFSVPPTWVGTNVTDDRGSRESLANAAAQALVQRISSNGSLSDDTNSQALASMYSTLALQDSLSGNQTWKNITTSMKTWTSQIDIFTNGTAGSRRTTSNALQWGLAYFYAYQAYNDTSLLSLAQNTYDQVFPYFISHDAASNYMAPGHRNLTFNVNNSQCFTDAAGGIFWLTDTLDDAQIQLDAVGPFAILSGYLYQISSNDTYKTNGLLAIEFMGWPGYIFNATDFVSHAVVDVFRCSSNTGLGLGAEGWYIQALSIWADITGDDALTERLRQVVSATARNTAWAETGGILRNTDANLSDNPWDDKAILIRALSETRRRFAISADLAGFITSFLTIQYNALSSSARQTGSSSYPTSLVDPPPSNFSTSGNIVALDVLNAAFDAASSTTTVISRSSTPVGAIVGGVVGGVAGLVALAGTLFWCHRHRQHARLMIVDEDKPELEHTPADISPYTLISASVSSGKGASPSAVNRAPVESGSAAGLGAALPEGEGPARLQGEEQARSEGEEQARSEGEEQAQPEEVSTMMGLRRLVNSILQEHASQSAPPAYVDQ